MTKKRILIVDDEPDLVEAMTARLEGAGYEIIAASNGFDGLEKARAERPDLIVLDLMLPRMDGYKVCGLLKNDIRYRTIPIIMFTARAHPEDAETARALGADYYLNKPFNTGLFMEQVNRALKQHA